MDRAFLEYYEEELSHIRSLAREFASLHPNVAGNLQIESAPCPDPYVERLLEGVAFLAARTRLKVDAESSRYVRSVLDALYPDLAGPSPAMTMARLAPGPQVERMVDGYTVKRGTRLVSGLREGLSTRCVYTTSQPVDLWPIDIDEAEYLQDQGALARAGVPDASIREAQSGLRISIKPTGASTLDALALDRLAIYFGADGRGGDLFDAVHGFTTAVMARPADRKGTYTPCGLPQMQGVSEGDELLPRVRASFEGYRLLREYFLMPERFYGATFDGLSPAIRAAGANKVDLVLLFSAPRGNLMEMSSKDLSLFVTPVVNLFERECDLVELKGGRSSHVLHADRARPRDFEVYRVIRVEDAKTTGAQARVRPLFSMENAGDSGYVYATDRRPRRPDSDEMRRGQTRSSYVGDDFLISLARPATETRNLDPITQLDVRALCTNRDLPILDDSPTLTLESGDPVGTVKLMMPVRRPRPSLRSTLPTGTGGETGMDDLVWRWVAQLSLNHLSLAAEEKDAEPLRAVIKLYADRGDPTLERHGRSVTRVRSQPLIERLVKPGPLCFGHGTQIELDINESLLSGGSDLLLSALLARLFARHAGINSFVRTRTHLTQSQTEVTWPMMPGTRALI